METNEYSQIHCRDTQISVQHLDGGCQNHIVLAGRERVSKQHAEKRLNKVMSSGSCCSLTPQPPQRLRQEDWSKFQACMRSRIARKRNQTSSQERISKREAIAQWTSACLVYVCKAQFDPETQKMQWCTGFHSCSVPSRPSCAVSCTAQEGKEQVQFLLHLSSNLTCYRTLQTGTTCQ